MFGNGAQTTQRNSSFHTLRFTRKEIGGQPVNLTEIERRRLDFRNRYVGTEGYYQNQCKDSVCSTLQYVGFIEPDLNISVFLATRAVDPIDLSLVARLGFDRGCISRITPVSSAESSVPTRFLSVVLCALILLILL